ncbi:MAG: VOC family protein [Actinomycetota bacterium]|nr:VOC family protein [Actinomycetota bacterium]MDH5225587.1 VOC family protein [Actinomycetota bacterium]
MRIDAIVFDCEDAAPLARFWAAALEWRVAPYDADEVARLAERGVDDLEDDPSVMVEPTEDDPPGLPVLFFTEVPERKAGKNRLHIDVVADESVDAEVIRLEGLGATLRNWAEEEGNVWAVMLDPEGNEFCVMPAEA